MKNRPIMRNKDIFFSRFRRYYGLQVKSDDDQNDSRKSLFTFSHRELKIAPGDAVPARVREPLAGIRESELATYERASLRRCHFERERAAVPNPS
jgi:hypothetical protein